jgi:hypothetical protein
VLDVLIKIAEQGENESARVAAADKVIDRALGKAPQHIDITVPTRDEEVADRGKTSVQNLKVK